MTKDWFERVQDVYHSVAGLSVDEREPVLARLCADDPSMRREVTSLLLVADRPDDGLLDPAGFGVALDDLGPPAAPIPAGACVGPYEIIRPIGSGGMGDVYLARQSVTDRRVALKIIRTGIPGSDDRFTTEAQALGRLAHPSIARIYEAGVHDGPTGPLPFIAMEYVEGPTLDRYVRDETPSLSERLRLILAVGDGLHHAHQKGVIHRDLKPANIIVESSPNGPTPRILDFGIARLADDERDHGTTRTGQIVGTVQYMSPEQAAGTHDIDTRADLYALGVITYEVLTDAAAFDLDGQPLHECVRIICEDDPIPADRVRPELRGDLATVIGTALRKDRTERYDSAAEMAADIRRSQRNEPILAHPPSATYQLRKFVRRHRLSVAAVVTMFVFLLAGVTGTTWQSIHKERARRDEAAARLTAERRLQEARDLARALVFDVHAAIADLPGSLDARRLLVATGVDALDRLAAESEGDVPFQAELAAAYAKLGDIQAGQDAAASLGDPVGAIASYERALALLATILQGDPSDGPAQRNTWLTLMKLSEAQVLAGHAEVADATFQRAEAIAETRAAEFPDDRMVQRDLSLVHERRARALTASGRHDAALDVMRVAQRTTAAQLDGRPDDAALRRDLAVLHFQCAMALSALGRTDEAGAELTIYLDLVQALADAAPDSRRAASDLAAGHERVGDWHAALSRPHDALAAYGRSLATYERLHGADPNDVESGGALAVLHSRVGELALAEADYRAAETSFARFHELAHAIAVTAPADVRASRRYAVSLYKLGELERARAMQATASDAERRAHRAEAVRWLDACLDAFVRLEADGRLGAADARVPDMLRAEIGAMSAE